MYLTTVAILTILIMVISLMTPEAFPPGLGFFMIFFAAFIIAFVLAVPIWVVWRAFRGVISFQKSDAIMYSKTVAILTPLIAVLILFSPERFILEMGLFTGLLTTIIIAAICAAPIWIVWRVLKGRITFQRNDWIMCSVTLATLTIMITIINIFSPEEPLSAANFITTFIYSLMGAAILSFPIWIVWRAFRGVKLLQKKKEED